VQRYDIATSLLAQTTLRDIVGQKNLDELLAQREELNKSLQEILDLGTDPWGIKVSAVTIKDVSLPEEMLRAIAKQAEAEAKQFKHKDIAAFASSSRMKLKTWQQRSKKRLLFPQTLFLSLSRKKLV
jgi:regulator of protease activity HflC (stomatin/prohibitin superfamily)